MTSDNARPIDPLEAAGHWFALQRSGEMTAQQAREMRVWLEQDLAHRAAYDELEQVWSLAADARSDPHILALREAELAALRPRRRKRQPRPLAYAAIAASLMVVVFGSWIAVSTGLLDEIGWMTSGETQEFHTGIGQRTTINLDDGSVVTLDTNSAIRTRETGRRRLVELEQGRAFFRVAKDPARPFIVRADGKTVTATGTAFDVRTEPGLFMVTLVDGRVTVEAPKGQYWRGRSTDMTAGWRLVARDDGQWTVSRIDVGKEIGWLSGRLIFENDRLSDVVAELNRYSAKKVVLRDAEIADAPVVGGFKAGDVSGFVKVVQAYRLARVVSDTDEEVVLGAPLK